MEQAFTGYHDSDWSHLVRAGLHAFNESLCLFCIFEGKSATQLLPDIIARNRVDYLLGPDYIEASFRLRLE